MIEPDYVSPELFTDWHGCYDESWKGVIVDEAFAHPAKYANGLITRIVDHGLQQGYWAAGSLVADPFGGVALGGVICGARGVNWLGVELEERFVELGNQNLAKHGPLFMHSGATCVKLVQGDSRQFAAIVGEVAGVVCSPPYAEGLGSGGMGSGESLEAVQRRMRKNGATESAIMKAATKHSNDIQGDYGDSPGQIGSLKTGSLEAVISSPPYADSIHDGNGIDQDKLTGNKAGKNTQAKSEGYGSTPGNIGNLKAGELTGIVTSPPWQDSLDRGVVDKQSRRELARSMGISNAEHISPVEMEKIGKRTQEYGNTVGQIGSEKSESYWQAMRLVYDQCHQAIKPGGVLACVVKDFVKGGERVPLCDQTCQLLESCGFTVFERTRCHLVKETRQRSLFDDDDIVTTKSRKSFFRRLAEKNGSPEINWEEVIWCKA